jgi:hypothetical protein
LVAVSLTLAIGCAEWLLRGLAPDDPRVHFAEPSVYRFDDARIYAMRPGADGANSLGLRDHEFGAKENRIRVLALGDSFTYGHGVARNSAYPQLLERKLNRGSQRRFEVINAGVPGYNFDQAFALLPELLPLQPDWVLLIVEPKDLGGANVLYTIADGKLADVPAWHNWIYLQLWLRSSAPEFLRDTGWYRFALQRLTGSDPFGTLPSAELDTIVEWQIDKIGLMIEEMLALGREHDFELMIVNYPDRSALEHRGDYRHGTYFRGSAINVLGGAANRHIDRLRREIRDSDAHFVDGLEAFVARSGSPDETKSLYLPGDAHMSRIGNRLFAEVLAAELVAAMRH